MQILPPGPHGQPQANDSQIQAACPILPNELMGQIILLAINQPAVYIFDLTFDNSFGACFVQRGSLPPSSGRIAFHPVWSPPPIRSPIRGAAKAAEKNENKQKGDDDEEEDVSPMALEKRGTYEPQTSKTIRALIAVDRFFRSEAMRHLEYISVPTATNRLNKVWFNAAVHVICFRHTRVCPAKILGPNPEPWAELNSRVEHLGFLHSNFCSPVLRIFAFMFPTLQKLYSVVIDHQARAEQDNDNSNSNDKRLPLEPIFQERQLEFYSPVQLHMFKRLWVMAKGDILAGAGPSYLGRDAAGRTVRSKPFIQEAILEGLILR